MANYKNQKSKPQSTNSNSQNASLLREYEAHKDCTPEELEEYLNSLPPSAREQYKQYVAKVEREKRIIEQAKKEDAQNRMGCLLIALVFAGFIGFMAYFQDKGDSDTKSPTITETKEESKSGSKQSYTATAVDESEEEKSDAKTKALKQAEFSKWHEATDKQAEIVESNWKILWDSVLNSLSKDKSKREEVVKNIDNFEKKLEESKIILTKMDFSKQLTKDEQEKLKEANADYIVWIEERKEACDKVKEIVDKDLTPEKLKEIEEAIKKSNTKMKTIKSRIIEFQKGMGLISE